MANKYFQIEARKRVADFGPYNGYENSMRLELIAYVGKESRKGVAIAIHTESSESGVGKSFIQLEGDVEIKALIDALQARINGDISAIAGADKLPFIKHGKMVSKWNP